MLIIPIESASLSLLATDLQKGAVIAYPTETCYGLGCDARNAAAVEKIFRLKQRPANKSVIFIIDDIAMIEPYVEITEKMKQFAKAYWPGAVTLVAPVKNRAVLSSGIVNEDDTIAFRVSSHPFARGLAHAIGAPLVSTSANIAGSPNPYTPNAVISAWKERKEKPDILIDAGQLPEKAPTTVVRFDDERITVLRQGDVIVSDA